MMFSSNLQSEALKEAYVEQDSVISALIHVISTLISSISTLIRIITSSQRR
jgi:hypothetical protein